MLGVFLGAIQSIQLVQQDSVYFAEFSKFQYYQSNNLIVNTQRMQHSLILLHKRIKILVSFYFTDLIHINPSCQFP